MKTHDEPAQDQPSVLARGARLAAQAGVIVLALWVTNLAMAPVIAKLTCRNTGIESWTYQHWGFGFRVVCNPPAWAQPERDPSR